MKFSLRNLIIFVTLWSLLLGGLGLIYKAKRKARLEREIAEEKLIRSGFIPVEYDQETLALVREELIADLGAERRGEGKPVV